MAWKNKSQDEALTCLALLLEDAAKRFEAGDINFHREAARNRINRNDDARVVLRAQKNALHPAQNTGDNRNALPGRKLRMRRGIAEFDAAPDAVNLFSRDNGRRAPGAD